MKRFKVIEIDTVSKIVNKKYDATSVSKYAGRKILGYYDTLEQAITKVLKEYEIRTKLYNMEMNGTWAIVNTSAECIEIFEGNIISFDTTKYENYGGEIKVSSPYEYREGEVGKVFNHELDKFQ